MSYDPALDTYASHAGFGVRAKTAAPVTAAPGDLAPRYPKAIVAIVPTGTASPSITVKIRADDTATPIPLPEGITVIDWVTVQAVTVIAAGVTVLRLDD